MHWNYCVAKKSKEYAIYEAYYDEENKLRSLSLEPVSPTAESLEALRTLLENMVRATANKVIDYEKIVKNG